MFNVGNVLPQPDGGGTLILGPAERADVIVDFSQFRRQDPDPLQRRARRLSRRSTRTTTTTPARPDRTDMGGAPPVLPGVGPNIRTVMQIMVVRQRRHRAGQRLRRGHAGQPPGRLQVDRQRGRRRLRAGRLRRFPGTGHRGQKAYNVGLQHAFPATWPNWGVSRISDTALELQVGRDGAAQRASPMKPKAIHDEMGGTFDDYGRMSAKLGLEVPFANAAIATFALQNYVDPPTEILDGPRDPDLEDHPQRRRHPPDPLPPVRRAGDQPGRLGRLHPAARPQRAGLEGHRPDDPAGGHDRRPAADQPRRCPSRSPTASGR